MLERAIQAVALSVFAVASAPGAVGGEEDPRGFELSVGDPAPALVVEGWLRGSAVTAFAPGATYVIEFWATWCGPCLRAIPHISELQARYAENDPPVRFVGVSIWEDDPEKVGPLVERMGEGMAYTVATDRVDEAHPEGTSATHWMDAAGQTQIPTAFVIDGAGRIAWIGHPLDLDRPLAKIVAGEWDLAAARTEHERRMSLVLARQRLGKRLAELSQAGKWKEAVRVVETTVADHPNLELDLGLHKYELLARGGDREACRRYGERLVTVVFKDEPGQLGALAWSIANPRAEIPHRDLVLARRSAERANELTKWTDASLVDTLAAVVFEQGDAAKAISLQERAVRLAEGTPLAVELERRLERYRGEGDGPEGGSGDGPGDR